MDFNAAEEVVTFVNLNDIASCKLIATTENNSAKIIKIEFEFGYKEAHKKELVQFYTIENEIIDQVCLYEDHLLAQKWTKIITDCIS